MIDGTLKEVLNNLDSSKKYKCIYSAHHNTFSINADYIAGYDEMGNYKRYFFNPIRDYEELIDIDNIYEIWECVPIFKKYK